MLHSPTHSLGAWQAPCHTTAPWPTCPSRRTRRIRVDAARIRAQQTCATSSEGGSRGAAAAAAATSLLLLLPCCPDAQAAQALQIPPPGSAPSFSFPSSFPPLPAIQSPKLQEATLPNGLHVVLLEDHEVPLVRGSLLMRGGQYASPSDKVGLASLSLTLQRGGGSEQHPGPRLDEELESVAASVEGSAGQQAFVLSFTSGTQDLPKVLGLYEEVLKTPALPEDRLRYYKAQVLDNLEHQFDSPSATANKKLKELMYGPQSIFARAPTPQTINSITVQDIREFLAMWERPDNATLGLVGDFQAPAMLQLLEEGLGQWQVAPGQPQAPPQVQIPEDPLAPAALVAGKTFLVDRPGLTQASVIVAEPGVALGDKDADALDVASSMLNGFGGTLFDQVRSRQGLAYSVSGGWQTPPGHPGLFLAAAQTQDPAALLLGLGAVLKDVTLNPPSADKLAEAKETALNTFVFSFASKSTQLLRTLIYDLLGLPRDLLFQYKAAVQAVQPDDVLQAVCAHLHPDRQVTVIVADAKAVRAGLLAAGIDVQPLVLEPGAGKVFFSR